MRAHDVAHGINLEKAGATAVIPEILEPSLQLAAAVLGTLEFQQDEVSVRGGGREVWKVWITHINPSLQLAALETLDLNPRRPPNRPP